MTALVVYDSLYGNTETIAEAIASAVLDAEVHRLFEVDPAALPAADLLVVGSPTQGGQPTAATRDWLARLPAGSLTRTRVGAFDTRLAKSDHGFLLGALMNVIGFAAPRILKQLESRGGRPAAAAEGFVVAGREGPLQAGELQRAGGWASGLVQS